MTNICKHGLLIAQQQCYLCDIQEDLSDLAQRMVNYDQAIWKYIKNNEIRRPHKCPVCNGKKFHTIDRLTDNERDVFICNPCEGKGIVWG